LLVSVILELSLVGPGEGNNQDKVPDRQSASADEPQPLLAHCILPYARCEGGDYKYEMSDSTKRHHHRYKLLNVTCVQRCPERYRTRLHQVGDEQAEAIPHDSNAESSPKSPRAVMVRKNNDCDVDDSLQEVKRPKLGHEHRRHNQRYKEERRSEIDPRTREGVSAQRVPAHVILYDQFGPFVPTDRPQVALCMPRSLAKEIVNPLQASLWKVTAQLIPVATDPAS
jgi:hypothetical protein